MLTIRAMSGGAGYAQRHLEHSDYYDEHRRVQGEWNGRGAELLGLRGEVTREQFEAIREGLNPETGEFLRPRHSADRVKVDGSEQSKGRSLYDLTFSAPKSISIQALVGGDDRLVAAHDKAVREALAEAESHTATRVRLNGANENRATGNWIVAAYRHDTSRELDPQLHTHAVAANLTYDGVEGRWKALQASGLYERRAYLTEVYRNALAREVHGLGYEIGPRRDSRGRDHGFEIRGVSNELLETYSVRSAQRDAAIEQFKVENGRKPTDNEVAVLVRESRADKLAEISTERVREQQQARLAPEERQTLQSIRAKSIERHPHISQELSQATESLEYAKAHLFERNSVVRDFDLMTEALRHGRGRIDPGQLRGALEVEQSEGSLIRAGNHLATRESLEREQRMIAAVDRGVGCFERLGGEREFQPSDRLRDEQRRAVNEVLASRDLAINLCGAAGTGKTATLQEIERGLREAGRKVMAVAPTRSAVEELHKVGIRDAMTVSRLLEDETQRGAVRGKALIVDEAGMISGRQMDELLKLAEHGNVRLLFSGDTRQIQSVEASDALRILERESQMKSVSLTGVQRQTRAEYRDAIQTLRDSPEQGFEKLEKLGSVREVPYLDTAHTIAAAYRELAADPSRKVLVVAGTHEEIARITQAYTHLRVCLEILDKIDLFTQFPEFVEIWGSDNEDEIWKKLAPPRVREKLGRDSRDPMYTHFSREGSHATFRALQPRIRMIAGSSDDDSEIALMLGGRRDPARQVSILIYCILVTAQAIIKCANVFEDRLNPTDVAQLVTSVNNDCSAFFRRFLDSVDRSKESVGPLEVILASWESMRKNGQL